MSNSFVGKLRGISKNVISLGWVSFFTDVAGEMLYPVIPLFVVGSLGAAPVLLGFIDGLAEGISSGLRWIGGALSDRYRSRKPFVFLGYFISALSKPIMGLAQVFGGWPIFLIGRCSDRLGKSIRTSARDAMIADSSDPESRGIAFGFHRMMDTCGAVVGPLMTLLIIAALVGWTTTLSAQWKPGNPDQSIAHLPLKWLFFFSLIPGLIGAGFVIFGVTEVLPKLAKSDAGPPPIFQKFPPAFWKLILANGVFSLGNSSDTFLLLRSGEMGLGFAYIILAYAFYNVVNAAAATPLGHISDRIGRRGVIGAGWLIYAGVYAGFAVWQSSFAPWILLAVYGLYQAFTDGVSKAMVSDLVPSEQRAGAIGMFYTVSGLGQFLASLLVGAIWNYRPGSGGVVVGLLIGAVFAIAGAALMVMVPKQNASASEA